MAHTTDAEIALAEADLRATVRQSFFALAVSQARVSITRELLEIGERARGAAEARVQAGDAARLELVLSDLAKARFENDAAAAMAELNAARADLNTLLGRLPTAPLLADANLGIPSISLRCFRGSRPHRTGTWKWRFWTGGSMKRPHALTSRGPCGCPTRPCKAR